MHHNIYLKHSNVTDIAGIQTYNFSFAQSLIQIMDFPTHFPNKSEQQSSLFDLLPALQSLAAPSSYNS